MESGPTVRVDPLSGCVGQSPIFGAGVFPHSGAGGQVLTVPALMAAVAVSMVVWMSAGSLLAAS